jgi:Fur family peroxide stress response transcriptional regulator
MSNKGRPALSERFLETCRKHGLKVTPQRAGIFQEVSARKDHPSADDVYRSVRGVFPTISFDTVNRTLVTLAEIGLIDVVEGLGNRRRYEGDTTLHHHFHCTVCGRIIDFTSREFDTMKIPDDIRRRFHVYNHRVVLTGLCPTCRLENHHLSHHTNEGGFA